MFVCPAALQYQPSAIEYCIDYAKRGLDFTLQEMERAGECEIR